MRTQTISRRFALCARQGQRLVNGRIGRRGDKRKNECQGEIPLVSFFSLSGRGVFGLNWNFGRGLSLTFPFMEREIERSRKRIIELFAFCQTVKVGAN